METDKAIAGKAPASGGVSAGRGKGRGRGRTTGRKPGTRMTITACLDVDNPVFGTGLGRSTTGTGVSANDRRRSGILLCPSLKEQGTMIQEESMLVSPNEQEYDDLVAIIKGRIDEGNGETIFDVGDISEGGLSKDDFDASVATLQSIADSLEASMMQLRIRGTEKLTAQYLIRHRAPEQDFTEIRVAVVGNVDAGKSTLLGVLTHGELDNGRGHARMKLFRHKHEMESGRTSSVGNDILGFDHEGNVVNKADHGSLDWVHICEKASKVITFIDLAGHERYLKTTVFGMTGHAPHFGMLMVGSNAGVVGMTKEHLGLALALSVPVFVVVTKIDMCPSNVLQETLQLLVKVLKSPGCRKVPVIVKTADDVVLSATNFVSERLCPVFQVSNVTGENLNLLKMFLNLLTTRSLHSASDPAEFLIDDTYSVPGVGTVVSGTCLKGTITLNDILLLGPDPLGHFQSIAIKSIHRKRMPVKQVRAGQTASFSLKKIKRSQIRKGMVLVSPSLNPTACWEFEAEILVLHHPTTISARYQAMVHCGSIRQTASILSMSKECLRTGDKAVVHFKFIKNPEYLNLNQRLVFREGRTKAVGNVSKVIPMPPTLGSGHGAKAKVIKNAPKNVAHQQQQQQQQQQQLSNENAIPSANGNGSAAVAATIKEDSPDPASLSLSKRNSLEEDVTDSSLPLLETLPQQGSVGQGQKRNGKRGGRRKHAAVSGAGGAAAPLAESNI